MIIQMKRRDVPRRRRQWRMHLIVFPRLLTIEGRGACWCFLQRVESRYSLSRNSWMYRQPRIVQDRDDYTTIDCKPIEARN